MKKYVLAGAALCASIAGGPALAADLAPSPAPVYKAQPVAAAYDWTGFYVGVHVGYDWMRSTDAIAPANLQGTFWLFPGEISTPNPLDPRGLLAGGQVGYNWQFSPRWVAGVEADLSWTDLKTTVVAAGTVDSTRIITVNENADWLGTLRGRLGVTPADRLLAYVTGGLAFGHGTLSTALTRTNGCVLPGGGANNCQQGSVSATNVGWTAGAGVEWAFARQWSAKFEYLHYDLGTLSHLMTDPNFASVWTSAAELKGDIVRGGVNFRFAGP